MKEEEFKKLRELMVDEQIIKRGIKDKNVIEAMKNIPRDLFVLDKEKDLSYEDYPLPIGYGQTISQPYIVALMTEALELTPHDKVLEIGTGSGYQTAILASIAKEVYTIERINELLEASKKVLEELKFKNINFFNKNGWFGLEEFAPYDKIIVTAAPVEIPNSLIEQLKIDGIMVIPVGDYVSQFLYKIKKNKKGIEKEILEAVRFVPLLK